MSSTADSKSEALSLSSNKTSGVLVSGISPAQFNAPSSSTESTQGNRESGPTSPRKRIRLKRPSNPSKLIGHPLASDNVSDAFLNEAGIELAKSENTNLDHRKTKSTAVNEDGIFFLDFGNDGAAPTGGILPGSLEYDLLRMEAEHPMDLNKPQTVSSSLDLLLPSHVFRTGVPSHNPPDVTSASVETSSVSGPLSSDIQFVDEDNNTGVQRYFHVSRQFTLRSCSTCGKYGHLARTCKVLVCWTCGTRDAHESRDCPINITCWNCGRRGHASTNCAEPRARRQCQLCGSRQHVQNSCPSLWRIYHHLSPQRREEAFRHRASKIGLELGGGGEGFIAWSAECFVCGAAGHWGYDCSGLPRGLATKEPPAFSRFHADTGPWPFESGAGDHSGRFALVSDNIRRASGACTGVDDEPAALRAGRKGKEKRIRLAREGNPDHEFDQEDDDWFNNTRPAVVASASNSTKRSQAIEEGGRRHRERKMQDVSQPSLMEATDKVAVHSLGASTSAADRNTWTNRKRRAVHNRPTLKQRKEHDLDYQLQYRGRHNKSGDLSNPPQARHRIEAHKGVRDKGDVRDRVLENPSPPRHPTSARSLSTKSPNGARMSEGGRERWDQEDRANGDRNDVSGGASYSPGRESASRFGSKWRGGYTRTGPK